MIASAVLARLANGIFFDPQEGELVNGDEAIELARQTAQEIDDDG